MLKSITFYTLISITSAFITFITTVYLSRLLSPEEFAYIGLFGVVIYILNPILSLNTVGLVGINIINLPQKQYFDFINRYITFIIFISILIFMISVIVSILLPTYQILLILTFFVAIFMVFITIHNVELIQNKKIKLFGFYRVLMSILNLISIFIFIQILDLSWKGRLFGIIITNILILLLMLRISFFSLKNYSFTIDYASIKEYLHYGYPLLFGLGAAWLTTQLDKFIVLYFFELKDLGYYSLGYTIGISFSIVNQSLVNAVTPRIYTILKTGSGRSIIDKYSLYYNISVSVLVFIGIVFMYFFGGIILSESYSESLNIILLVMVAVAFDGMYRVYGLVINYYKENKLKTKMEYLIVFINIIFSMSLIPFLGLLAPAIGTIISYLLAFLISKYFAKRLLLIRGVK